MITCGWCNTHYQSWRNRCDSCGGPMPALPGQELGEEPPAAPRKLPKGFAFRTRWSHNFASIAGAAFLLVGSLLFSGLVQARTYAAAIPFFFMLGGFFLLRHGWIHASGVLRAFREGTAIRGEVHECRLDKTQSMNGEHPFKLTWHFLVDGHEYEGSLTSFDSTLGSRARGQPLWVLFVPNDPQTNTLYPPVR